MLFRSGMMLIEKIPFRIVDLMQSVEIMFSTKAHEKKLTLQVSIDEKIPPFIIGDPTRLTQILVNLVSV